MRASDSPIFATMITELGQQLASAEQRASLLTALLGDLEALHESDGDGECPACHAPAPCLTSLILRGDISVEQAYGALRDQHVIDLIRAERDMPPVPSLAELLAQPTRGMDRFFDALLGLNNPADKALSEVPETTTGEARAS